MSFANGERLDLYNEIRRLSSALERKVSVVKRLDAYYLPDAHGNPEGDPYCLLCWERDYTLLHLIRKSQHANCCPYCDREYLAETTVFGIGGEPRS